MKFTYEKVTPKDRDIILELGEAINEKHVVPLLDSEGQQAIRAAFKSDMVYVKNSEIYSAIKAVVDGEIVGYIAWRDGSYIGHLYVKTKFHGCGIAKRLVDEMKVLSGAKSITVKASIYALGFYKKVGFKPTSEELKVNGIRYVPMKLDID